MKLLLATRNAHKVTEMRRLLAVDGWELVSLDGVAGVADTAEDGATYAENACQKARAAFAASRSWTLAEDSGLEVDALGGEPGIRSARYCGPDATDRERNRYLLDRIIAVPAEQRTARFRCVACLIDPQAGEHRFEGVCEGTIAPHVRGSSGFGYDPVFVPAGHRQTFAELGSADKDRISHRGRAMAQVAGYLRAVGAGS